MDRRLWWMFGGVLAVVAALGLGVAVLTGGDGGDGGEGGTNGSASSSTTSTIAPPSKDVARFTVAVLEGIDLEPLVTGAGELTTSSTVKECEAVRSTLGGLDPAQLIAVSSQVADRPLGDALIEERRAFDVALTSCLNGTRPTAEQIKRLQQADADLQLRRDQIEEAAS